MAAADDAEAAPPASSPAAGVLWSLASVAVPIFSGEPMPIGPSPIGEVIISLICMSVVCFLAGRYFTHSTTLLDLVTRWQPELELREEAWTWSADASGAGSASVPAECVEEATKHRRSPGKRSALELLFIVVHNGSVSVLAALAWFLGSRTLARHAFCLEVAYELFDSFSLGLKRLEPETLIHHVVSPICILCSMRTQVDFRVLCQLCICIDLSGAALGYAKFLLQYTHSSASMIYRRLFWVYLPLRVIFPLVDSALIVHREYVSHGGLLFVGGYVITPEGGRAIAGTDSTQLYFWAMAVLNAFNCYFCCVIRARARMSPQVVARVERMGCH
eukprot:TRINITY_DN4752_c0_g1_i1.p1 TRINITY_DN4752_c0_g1~~TRINITY_DN4752_c0_g1_i1.p1  ORF type:complete len:332 (+),score=63.80 TRINITY_DN4752_c0_g1_i1:105-1100(+)